jgi:hypothetical protein
MHTKERKFPLDKTWCKTGGCAFERRPDVTCLPRRIALETKCELNRVRLGSCDPSKESVKRLHISKVRPAKSTPMMS